MHAASIITFFFVISFSKISLAVLSCAFQMPDIYFGNSNLLAGSAIQTQSTLTIICANGVPNKPIRLCTNISFNSIQSNEVRTLSNGSKTIAFNIYKDPAYQVIWGSQTDALPSNPLQTDMVLDSQGNGTQTVSIYASILANQATAATGQYSVQFDTNSSFANYRMDPAKTDTCKDIIATGIQQGIPFSVYASYTGSCNISSSISTLEFGTISFQSATTSSASITVQCSSGYPFQIGLDGGLQNSIDPLKRAMKNSTGQILYYGLFQDQNFSIPWGNISGTNTLNVMGTGFNTQINIYGSIPKQNGISSGNYSDTVQVILIQ